MVPDSLLQALQPVTVVVGHYGAGKTNFCMNIALSLAEAGNKVTVVDLDVVNPYFRASEQRSLLEQHDIRLVAPVFSEAGTSLDVPSLTGQILPAIQDVQGNAYTIVDAGGDDVGATALGRFAHAVRNRPYAVLYVANAKRNLVSTPEEALANMREIEAACHLNITGIVSNAHLKDLTTEETVIQGAAYAEELAQLAQLGVCCVTVPVNVGKMHGDKLYAVQSFVKNPWE